MNLRPKFKSLICLALAGFLFCGASADSSPETPVKFFTSFGGSPFQPDERMKRYDFVIWHNHPEIVPNLYAVKKFHPKLKALMYRELFCVLQKETPHHESVGGFESLPEEWFQKDLNGNRVEVPDYPGRWMMDLANPDWQDYWIKKTLQDVKENQWDGVFADDALTKITAHDLPPLAGYPDDTSLQDAISGFLKKITAAFRKEGKLVIINASSTYEFPDLWDKWLDLTDGIMEEHFAGDGWTWGDHVPEAQLKAIRSAIKKKKFVFLMTYGDLTDEKKMKTSLAAYLAVQGPRVYWCYRPPSGEGELFQEDEASYALALQYPLGKAVSKPFRRGAAWGRKYQHGRVTVNTLSFESNIQTNTN